ncbi:hypothetical protein [Natronosalvus vescus]|uniref:hypothetical protein n=1 Tax=Natronosalvus vescus TaxID=2953881 RepID=UPI00209024C1|nr:hypothetical protein [Natronosalvus vescus]
MNRFDYTAFIGFVALVALSYVIETPLLGAAFGGFLLSLSVWRLYDGYPWEAIAWLAWVGAAVALVLAPGGSTFFVLFFGSLVVGVALLFGSRFDLLPDIWRTDPASSDHS